MKPGGKYVMFRPRPRRRHPTRHETPPRRWTPPRRLHDRHRTNHGGKPRQRRYQPIRKRCRPTSRRPTLRERRARRPPRKPRTRRLCPQSRRTPVWSTLHRTPPKSSTKKSKSWTHYSDEKSKPATSSIIRYEGPKGGPRHERDAGGDRCPRRTRTRRENLPHHPTDASQALHTAP